MKEMMEAPRARQEHLRVQGPAPFFESGHLAKRWNETEPEYRFIEGDCRRIPLPEKSVDLIVTSPPYWRKRDYGFSEQVGQESTPEEFAANIGTVMSECHRILGDHGNMFLNIGDTYHNKNLAGIPALLELEARKHGFYLRNRIIWAKRNGMPEPSQDRLANRHEYILHLSRNGRYYYDLHGYANSFGNGANPGDVWQFDVGPGKGGHLAPFPEELVERAIMAACPPLVHTEDNQPVRRIVERTGMLDPARPQAKRAMELADKAGLTQAHIRAIQSVGITDVGKARQIQNGVDRNRREVMNLARQAKQALGGYFREFTFGRKETTGWTVRPRAGIRRGIVFDPFVGSGTTLRVAHRLGLSGIGMDMNKWDELKELSWLHD